MNPLSAFDQKFRSWWRRLIEPTAIIQDEEQRRQSKLLASLMLALIIALVPVSIFPALLLRAQLPFDFRFLGTLAAMVISATAYRTARAGHYRAATLFLATIGSLLVLWLAVSLELSQQSGMSVLFYFAFIILYGSLFLRTIEIAWVGGLQVALTLSFVWFAPDSLPALILNVLIFNMMFVLLALVTTRHRDWLEQDRRQRLEQSEARFRGIFESAAAGVAITDLDGRVTDANAALATMLGYNREELTQLNFADFTHPEDLPREREYIQEMLAGRRESYRLEKRYIRKNGEVVWVQLTSSLIRSAAGMPIGGMAVVEEITERRKAEAQRLETALERERTDLMGRLVYAISHDFRNALATIETSRYLIQRTLPDSERPKIQPKLDTIQSQIAHLTEQLDNIKAIAIAYELNRQVCDLNALMGRLAAEYEPLAHERRSTLRFDAEAALPLLRLDVGAITRAIRHLILNAVYHAGEGVAITLRTRREQDDVVVEIHDTGRGIDLAHLPYIFDLFYRVDPGMPIDEGGTGLGLSVARLVAEAHRGSIAVESAPDKGTTFTLRLPIDPPIDAP